MTMLIGRILYTLIFLMMGMMHFAKYRNFVAYAEMNGVPMAGLGVIVGSLLAVLGGLSVVLGYKAKIGAWLLVGFLIPVTLFMHRFWGIEDPMMAQNQMAHFMKNLSMIGGALMIATLGSGPYSLDNR